MIPGWLETFLAYLGGACLLSGIGTFAWVLWVEHTEKRRRSRL